MLKYFVGFFQTKFGENEPPTTHHHGDGCNCGRWISIDTMDLLFFLFIRTFNDETCGYCHFASWFFIIKHIHLNKIAIKTLKSTSRNQRSVEGFKYDALKRTCHWRFGCQVRTSSIFYDILFSARFPFSSSVSRSFSSKMPWNKKKMFRSELKFKYLRMRMYKHTHTRAFAHAWMQRFIFNFIVKRSCYWRGFFMVIFGIHFTAIDDDDVSNSNSDIHDADLQEEKTNWSK